jgi:hypothetical protein
MKSNVTVSLTRVARKLKLDVLDSQLYPLEIVF